MSATHQLCTMGHHTFKSPRTYKLCLERGPVRIGGSQLTQRCMCAFCIRRHLVQCCASPRATSEAVAAAAGDFRKAIMQITAHAALSYITRMRRVSSLIVPILKCASEHGYHVVIADRSKALAAALASPPPSASQGEHAGVALEGLQGCTHYIQRFRHGVAGRFPPMARTAALGRSALLHQPGANHNIHWRTSRG